MAGRQVSQASHQQVAFKYGSTEIWRARAHTTGCPRSRRMDAHNANSQHRPQGRQIAVGLTRTLSKGGSVITELQYSAGKSAATRFQKKDLAAQLVAPRRACHQLLRRTSTATLGRLDWSLAQASPVFASEKLRSALCIAMQPLTALQVLSTKSCSGGH